MARSASVDILEKFRFDVVFFDNQNLTSVALNEDSSFIGGFTEVTLPKVSIKERIYRENIDPTSMRKASGLTTFEPIVLKKGKFQTNEAFNRWYELLVNPGAFISPITTVISDASFIPVYEPSYRKDLLLRVYDRSGQVRRAFFAFNAFPIAYNPGDLNSSAEEKLIEEMTITYENFVELRDDQVETLNNKINQAVLNQIAAGAAAALIG